MKRFTLAMGVAFLCSSLIFSSIIISRIFRSTTSIKKENDSEELQFIEEAWKQDFQRTKSPITGKIPKDQLLAAKEYVTQRLNQLNSNSRAIPGITWTERGPVNVGGRTRALLFDENDLLYKKVYAGAIDGGLWVCNDITAASPVWTKVNDQFDNLSVSTIAQQKTNPNNMYFGTGEGWFNVDAVQGLGIWKSTDNGATWSHLPSTFTGDFSTVQKIIVTDNGDVYAATNGGIMRSKNGGLSWEKVINAGAGADIEKAANGDLWASTGVFSPGKLWYSPAGSNAGDPSTWIDKTPSNPATSGMRRIEIALAPSDAATIYILGHDGNSNDCTNIWYSNNSGGVWTLRTPPVVTDQIPQDPNFTRGQAWYDLAAAVDPFNPLTLIIGGVDLHKSIDGGATWIHLTRWYTSIVSPFPYLPYAHADQHAIAYRPNSSNVAIFGNDGGIFYADNVSGILAEGQVLNVVTKDNGYNVTQFYACAMHPTNSNFFLAGAQDNGTQKFTTAGLNTTTDVTGGDGAFCHIDSLNPLYQVGAYVYSNYYLSTNGGASFSRIISDNSHGQFINPTDYDNNSKILYSDYSASGVGGAYGRWPVSGSTNTGITVTQFGSGLVTSVYVSPNISNRVYFGLSNGSVVYVNNANTVSSPATGTIVKTGSGSVSGIAIESGNENHMLVTYSNYDVVSVWETTDGGTTWSAVEGNLPNIPVRWIVFNPNNYDQAFIATEVGVWSTDNLNGETTEWNPTNGGLANCRVDMLQIAGNQMAAATHGRGLFTTTIPASATAVPQINFEKGSIQVAEGTAPPPASGCRRYIDVPVKMYISAAPTGDAIVNLTVNNSYNTATEGQDYDILPSKTLTFPNGSSAVQQFTIRIYDDENVELPDEFFTIDYSISGSTNAQKGTTLQQLTCRIIDNDYLKIPHNATTLYYYSGSYNTNLGGSSPLQGSQSDKKMQYIYRASELHNMGLNAGSITSLSFIVGTRGATPTYLGFTIKIGQTTLDQFTSGFADASSYTTVYSAPAGGYVPVAGENKFTLASPFNWNGTDNIIVQFCYNNVAAPPATGVSNVPSPDDILQGEIDPQGKKCQAKAVSTNQPADDGCAFSTPTLLNMYRPLLILGEAVPATPVQTILNRSKQAYLGPNEDVYFYDETDGKLMARIQNLSNIDYGCTTVQIDRAVTGSVYAQPFWDNVAADFLTSKSFRVLPSQNGNNTSGHYKITLYYTDAEKTGWETATGHLWSSTNIVRTTNGIFIPDVNPSNTQVTNVTIAPMTPGSVGTSFSATAEFSNSSFTTGFAVGSPALLAPLPTHLISFTGSIQSNHSALSWTVTDEDNRGYQIERSFDGRNFSPIGYVPAQILQIRQDYHFTDPSSATNIQYYRLAMINQMGMTKYSQVILLQKNSMGIGVQVYPTVTNGPVKIKFSDSRNETVAIDVYNFVGARVIHKVSSLQDNQFDLQKFASGTYTIRITLQKNNEILYTGNVIKQ